MPIKPKKQSGKKKSEQDVQKYIDKIWSILDPEGKRRRKHG